MKFMQVSELQAGQKIAKPVANKNGAVLCPAGFELTEAAISRLSHAGVGMVFIEEETDKALSPQERLAALEERFSGIADPFLLQLKLVIQEYFTELSASSSGRDAGQGE